MSKSFVRRRTVKTVDSFAKCSYLSQVRRLRRLGVEALTHYSINVSKVEFIHHGENATFKVTDRSGAKYLLRIHRDGYHSKKAIFEEVSWLERLVKSGQLVPAPIGSKTKEKVILVTNRCLDLQRYCCVFKWVDGRFINKSLSCQHMFKIGVLLAKLQTGAPKKTSRVYWDADGLIGSQATFGSFDSLEQATPKQQGIITRARKNTLSKL